MSRRKSKTKSTSKASCPSKPSSVSPSQASPPPGVSRSRKRKAPSPAASKSVSQAVVDSEWRGLNVRESARLHGELPRRVFSAAMLICVLPPLCALLLLPFFYRKSNAGVLVSPEGLERSQVYSLPEYEAVVADGQDLSWYEWVRLADPRQCLLPDWSAGFSRFNQFRPEYSAAQFPRHQSTKPARQPLYHELFALITPQSPKTLANEQVNLLWQKQNSLVQNTLPLKLTPSVHRPVWRFADGTPIAEAEAPVFPAATLDYWRNPDTRGRLAERMREAGDGTIGQTVLELQVPPGVKLPRVAPMSSDGLEAPMVVPRVVLRRSCGDGR